MIDLENDDTIQIVDYVKVDILNAGQLEVDDCILIGNEVVSIVDIVSLPDGYVLEVVNDFGERDHVEVAEFDQFDLMILQ
jgi:ribosome maturation factor RimP